MARRLRMYGAATVPLVAALLLSGLVPGCDAVSFVEPELAGRSSAAVFSVRISYIQGDDACVTATATLLPGSEDGRTLRPVTDPAVQLGGDRIAPEGPTDAAALRFGIASECGATPPRLDLIPPVVEGVEWARSGVSLPLLWRMGDRQVERAPGADVVLGIQVPESPPWTDAFPGSGATTRWSLAAGPPRSASQPGDGLILLREGSGRPPSELSLSPEELSAVPAGPLELRLRFDAVHESHGQGTVAYTLQGRLTWLLTPAEPD